MDIKGSSVVLEGCMVCLGPDHVDQRHNSGGRERMAIPSAGNVVRRDWRAVQENWSVSSTDFFQRLAAPTLPPITCNVAKRRDAASRSAYSVGRVVPFKKLSDRLLSTSWSERCVVG